MFKSLILAAFALVLAAPAMAQPATSASVTATLNVPTVLHIGVSSTAVSFTGDYDAYEAGYAAGSAATTVSHRGNVQHSVTLASDAASFTATDPTTPASTTDPARAAKPASDLSFDVDGADAWAGVSTTDTDVVTGAARGAHTGPSVAYRIALAYADDTPGTYTLGLTYTIAAD